MLFKQVKSGELLVGGKRQQLPRLKTELDSAVLKHSKSDVKKEWLERSNRLLEIVNKTSEVIADMRRCRMDRGYYKLPTAVEKKPRKHSHADRIEGEKHGSVSASVLKPLDASHVKLSIAGKR